jgi:hypothetical protein
MNERIQELLEQCQIETYGVNGELLEIGFDAEKFAQLIVGECMACSIWVGKNNTNTVEPIHTAYAINQRIKEHFGVEE